MISRQLAQKITNQIMTDIDYNINVMDDKGRIIASGNRERIGDIHQGAKKVMASKERNFIYEDTETEKKGINDPIFIDGQCVGVVGISGDPEDVLKIKNVVNTLFYFLISREVEINKQYSEKELRQKVVRKLIYQEEDLSEEEYLYLKKKSFNPEDDMVVAVIKGKMKTLTEPFFYIENSDHSITLLMPAETVTARGGLDHTLDGIFHSGYLCGVVESKKRLANAYQKAHATLDVIGFLQLPSGIYAYADHMMFVNALLYGEHDHEELNPGMVVIKQDELLYETLLAFIKHNGRMKETADALIIHRNTLLYRLNKIKKVSSWDPNTLNGLSNLVYDILISEKKQMKK